MSGPYLPRRAIHLDFHTGPDIPDVAAQFDATTFAEPFRAAGVIRTPIYISGQCDEYAANAI